jgi:Asp-tRNA(Asn)/Glu-tRNA(Gln) amidotransferase B subunit
LTVGVEIHAQLDTEAKLFSRESTPSAHLLAVLLSLPSTFWSRCRNIYE